MAKARRTGEGVYVEEWQLAPEHHSPAETVLEWCREVVARCRRPFGIDQFDLALALRPATGSPVSRMYRLRPADLYSENALEQFSAFLLEQGGQPGKMAAALFSWGDAAHRAMPEAR